MSVSVVGFATASVVDAASGEEADSATSTSVGKALALLNAFLGSSHTVLGVSEIARRADVAKSTAHRLLTVLEGHGLVQHVGAGWLLGSHLFRLGNSVSMCQPDHLRDRALPFMQELHAMSVGTVCLAVPHGAEVLYVAKLPGRQPIDTPAVVGGCMPMHCTALGKAMLAFSATHLFDRVVAEGLTARTTRTITDPPALEAELRRVRASRMALDDQECKSGLACIAAPVVRDGRVLGALSVSLPSRQGPGRSLAMHVVQAAEGLSASLAYVDDVLGCAAGEQAAG